ncbi:hypothetical protein BSAF29S_04163 [Bacillus safensis subsp. safensis]
MTNNMFLAYLLTDTYTYTIFSRNDLELMESAQYSFAVRNAIQEVKDAAHFITLSNEESGVMHTIQKILSLQP